MLKTAIVTGSNGYIGSALVRNLLESGSDVHALIHRDSGRLTSLLPSNRIHAIGDDPERVSNLVASTNPNAIFHLAAINTEAPNLAQLLSILQCSVVLGAALLHGATMCSNPPVFINTGSYWQFGEAATGGAPNSAYGAAKQAMHHLLLYFRSVRGLHGVTLVLYDVFGPDDPRPKLWTALGKLSRGSSIAVTEGKQRVELVHVSDVILAMRSAAEQLCANRLPDPIYAVHSDERLTLRELLERLNRAADLNLHFLWGARPYPAGQIFHPWEGKSLPNWKPQMASVTSLSALLRMTLPPKNVPHIAL